MAQSSLQQARTLAICNLAASGVQCPHGQSNFFFLCLIIVVGIRRLGGRQTDNKETKSNDSEKEGSTCPSIGNPFFSLFESPGDHGVMVKKGVQFQLFQGGCASCTKSASALADWLSLHYSRVCCCALYFVRLHEIDQHSFHDALS